MGVGVGIGFQSEMYFLWGERLWKRLLIQHAGARAEMRQGLAQKVTFEPGLEL